MPPSKGHTGPALAINSLQGERGPVISAEENWNGIRTLQWRRMFTKAPGKGGERETADAPAPQLFLGHLGGRGSSWTGVLAVGLSHCIHIHQASQSIYREAWKFCGELCTKLD